MFQPVTYQACMYDIRKAEINIDGEIILPSIVKFDKNNLVRTRCVFVTHGERPELNGHKFNLEMYEKIYGMVRLWMRDDSNELETRFDVEKVISNADWL